MNGNFEAVFDEPTQFNATFNSPEEFNADFQRLISVSDTTATADDVVKDKVFYNSDGDRTLGTYVWDFKGFRPELINGNLYNYTTSLADTLYATWTPSTTAKAIVATSTVGTFTADMTKYEYILRWRCQFDAVYESGYTIKTGVIREVAELWQTIMKRPNSLANIESENYTGNACVTFASIPLMVYKNSSGANTYTFAISYGIYPAVTAATFSNATSDTPTVTVKSPTYNARCSTTYFSTTSANRIVDADSIIKVKGELYRVPKGSTMKVMYENMIDLYNNGI